MAQSEALGTPAGAAASISSEEAASGTRELEAASSYCPRCSARLTARSCKMICHDCGYYMSCSDFY